MSAADDSSLPDDRDDDDPVADHDGPCSPVAVETDWLTGDILAYECRWCGSPCLHRGGPP